MSDRSDVARTSDTPPGVAAAGSNGAESTAAQGSTVLDARGLVAGYGGVPVVHGIDLRVGAGEVVALLGANGAGKTTTLLTVSGLLPLLGGELVVVGAAREQSRRVRPGRVASIARNGVAHVAEDRGLFFDLTVAENLRLGRPRRRRGTDTTIDPDQALGWFPVLARIPDRRAGLLSGGEQQMLAIARAVLGGPRLLMVDEMSLGLAPLVVEQLLPTMRTVAAETGAGVLLVEQHVALALSVADRAYVLDRGRVVLEGAGAELSRRTDLIESGYLGTAAPG